jgi:hypothetical protein
VVYHYARGGISLSPLRLSSDGTMQQANPDAGNARTSDSNGMGAGVIPLEQII